jgi:hypothetical protein
MKDNVVESHLVLEWFRDNTTGQINETTKQALIEMRATSDSPVVKRKYNNTLAFIDVLEKQWETPK